MKLSKAVNIACKDWQGTRSAEQYKRASLNILNECGDIPLDDIDLIKLHRTKWAKLLPSTQRSKVAILTRIMKLAQYSGWEGDIPRKPKILLDTGKAEFLTPQQFEKILSCIDDEILEVYFSFLFYTGLRPDSEALKVKRRDIKETPHGYFLDVPQVKTKPRRIPISSKLVGKLRDFGVFELEPSALIFKYRGYSYRNISKKWARIVRLALGVDGSGDYSLYILRHSTASNLHELGADIMTISEILGHSSLNTTRRYIKPSAKTKASALDML